MFEEDGKKTTPNASHDTFRGRFGIGHAFRHKRDDMEMTKDYYTKNPPQVGDKVVIIATASHSEMWLPEHCVIEAITDRGRIVVDHDCKWSSGKSFYKSGQNCMKPKGQTWLIPSALYVEDYISGDDARRNRTEHMKGKTIHDAQIERENDCIDAAKVRGQAKWDELPDQEKTRRIIKALR
jgi:hypothetical protein